ncbi:uncharacterized protein LOC143280282 [Babylonia areolata]|uniref:uncharacterized protein LOC143280282 n=1 Tax=Babylonia areolata TaxID=304850 RepID=UPI003FD00E12
MGDTPPNAPPQPQPSPPPPPQGEAALPPSPAPKGTECPVCHEEYTLPKLLPCNHLVCLHCIVDWLHKTDQKGGCPLCRAPILPQSPDPLLLPPDDDDDDQQQQEQHADDLQSLVEAMPTDMTMVGLVEGGKILSSRNVCQLCSNNSSAASSFCLQCLMKLCESCAQGHTKIPALKNHVVEALSDLTPERLAEISRSRCRKHEDRMADMYCPAHRELICTPCARKEHWGCGGVKEVGEAAEERRGELAAEVRELKGMETVMKRQKKALTGKFQAMRQKTNEVFDHIQKGVETRRHEILARVKAEEDKMALPQLDVVQATVTSSADVVGSWVRSAPDDALLEMTDKMRPRLTDLKQRITQESRVCRAELVFDSRALTQLESTVAGIGQVRQVQQPTSPNAPSSVARGAATPPVATPPGETQLATPPGEAQLATPPGEAQLAMPPGTRVAPSGLEARPVARARRAATVATSLGETPLATPLKTNQAPVVLGSKPEAGATTGVTPEAAALETGRVPFVLEAEPGARATPVAPGSGESSLPSASRATSSSSQTVTPSGLRTGDRVKRGPDWNAGNQDGKGLGRVIAVPSRIRAINGCDSEGFVDVKWDNGKKSCHRMGRYGNYDLQLA